MRGVARVRQEQAAALERMRAKAAAAAEEHALELRSQLALQRADYEGQVCTSETLCGRTAQTLCGRTPKTLCGRTSETFELRTQSTRARSAV